MSVRGKASLDIKGGSWEVFIIDINTDKTLLSGVQKTSKTIWYSEELGMALKRETKVNGKVYVFRVLDIVIPKNGLGEDGRRKNLGTILI